MASISENFGDSAPLISKSGFVPNADEPLTKIASREPYVNALRVAEHLSLTRREVLKLTRERKLPGHPIDPTASRKIYRYKLSEIDQAISQLLITEQSLGIRTRPRDNNDRQPRDQRG